MIYDLISSIIFPLMLSRPQFIVFALPAIEVAHMPVCNKRFFKTAKIRERLFSEVF